MLIEYRFQGIQFEWDRQKADINLQKHGISFETACEAFLDPFVQGIDIEEVDEELREAIIGMTISWKICTWFTPLETRIFFALSRQDQSQR